MNNLDGKRDLYWFNTPVKCKIREREARKGKMMEGKAGKQSNGKQGTGGREIIEEKAGKARRKSVYIY